MVAIAPLESGEEVVAPMPFNEIVTFVSAELIFVLSRSSEIQIAAKGDKQRTSGERERIKHGLARSLLLEAVVFVPASAVLLLLVSPLLVTESASVLTRNIHLRHALIGILSYGFPFVFLKRVLTRIALSTLREFVKLTPESIKAEFNAETQQRNP